MSILAELRNAVRASELSRYEIARRSGVDEAALSRFVAGGSLRVESIEKLCPALGLYLSLSEAADPAAKRITNTSANEQRRPAKRRARRKP
jgi:transcriptional regulator with XRE-family HTH domain